MEDINYHSFRDEADAFDLADDYNTGDEDMEIDFGVDPVSVQHAQKINGKYCVCNEGVTSFLKGLFCKVIAVNDCSRGGNPGQVRIIVYRNQEMFRPKTWMLIPEDKRFEVIGSTWLTETDMRPSIIDHIRGYVAYIVRITFSEIGNEKNAFHYKWWKDSHMVFHLPPLASIVGAFYDTAKAFKYGV